MWIPDAGGNYGAHTRLALSNGMTAVVIVSLHGYLPYAACIEYFPNISLTLYPIPILQIRKMKLKKIMRLA